MSTPDVTTISRTDVGRVRTRNEDHCGEFVNATGHRLLVVADGMGGHRAGAEASQLAVQTIGEVFAESALPPDAMLQHALEIANERIHTVALSDPELRGMGTTAVALLFCPDATAWVAHVGDSRAYRLRGGRLEPLTRDHSVVAELERRGLLTPDEAAVHPRRNEILRSVGVQANVEVDVAPVDLLEDDQFVLCSDGLSGLVPDADIASVVGSRSLEEAADLLIEMANDAGGPDNVTVQIARFGRDDPEPKPITVTDAFGSESSPAARPRPPSRAIVVCAVLIAGLAALTILWRVYSVSQTPAIAAPISDESSETARP